MGVALDSIQFRLREWAALADTCEPEPIHPRNIDSNRMSQWPISTAKPLSDQLAILVGHPDKAPEVLADRSPSSVFALLDAARSEVTRLIYRSELRT